MTVVHGASVNVPVNDYLLTYSECPGCCQHVSSDRLTSCRYLAHFSVFSAIFYATTFLLTTKPTLASAVSRCNIIIIITEMIFMVLSSWQSHCESSPGSFDECRLSAEVAANSQTKPTDLDCESARKKWQLLSASTIATLLLLSPRADTHFTIPRRVEG